MAAWFVVALAGTWCARRYALKHQMVDQPGERRAHQQATPRGGGIAIVVALLLAIGCLAQRDPGHVLLLAAIATGLCLVAGVGWIDDHRPLPPWSRLVVQAVAAAVLGWGIRASGGGIGTIALGCVAALVLVNVWNFMDGIDGLATTQALLAALGWWWISGPASVSWLALALVAACLGFLPFNLYKARIFLGDVGSGALGYALAALLAWLSMQDIGRLPMLMLPLTAFLVDASLTLAMRAISGQRWWLPHDQHTYQHWARHCAAHLPVTVWYGAWTVCASLLMLALAGSAQGTAFMMLALVGACLLAALAWSWLRTIGRRIQRGDRE